MRLAITSAIALCALILSLSSCGGSSDDAAGDPPANTGDPGYVVLGYSELGMHCINQDFSRLAILPPFNNLRAQVIYRGTNGPVIVDSGLTVGYSIPGNTHSSDKTNFWTYVQALFAANPPPDTGLTGNGLSGVMVPTGDNDWVATGIPLTPLTDGNTFNPFQLAEVTVRLNGSTVAQVHPVAAVSWEISCDLCHFTHDANPDQDILISHDLLHGTTLVDQEPVLCGSCHAQPELGTTGQPGLSNLSSAMHLSHAGYMSAVSIKPVCYACHPGQATQCLRDVHSMIGMDCTSCHLSMEAVGDPARRPWVDLPRCKDCHSRANFQFEEDGVLYRNSRGHHGVHCSACHGAPHAVAPSTEPADNVQAYEFQGHAGTISECSQCHSNLPEMTEFHHHLD